MFPPKKRSRGEFAVVPGQLPPSGFVRIRALCREPAPILPFSAATLYRKVATGRFPMPVKFDGVSAWRVEDVRRWIEQQVEKSGA
jgi:prophage regulatory protein